jgi:YWFCY protein/Type IV secretory system Conjugative DNA transfer
VGKNENSLFNFFLIFSIALLIVNCYFVTYPFWQSHQLNIKIIDDLLIKANSGGGFLGNPTYILLTALVLDVVFVIGSYPKKSTTATIKSGLGYLGIGCIVYFSALLFYKILPNGLLFFLLYTICVFVGFFLINTGFMHLWKILGLSTPKDRFNDENETFAQETKKVENEYSINITTKFIFKGKETNGWINVINPFRATMVIGNPGSGKSYAVIEEFMWQTMEKGYTSCIYDFKFPTQTLIQYNNLLNHAENFKTPPKFYVINLDDPEYSHRCNPLSPKFLTTQSDAVNASNTLLFNLNKSWVQKKGDFFVESPIALVSALIWYLRLVHDGKFCSLPHLIMLLSKSDEVIFSLMRTKEELKPLITTFQDALDKGAMEQLAGQTASARIPLSQLAYKELFWIFSGDDFDLDVNNPDDPKIICVGNNPQRETAYNAPLGLFFTQVIKEVNKKDKLPCLLSVDEFPSIYMMGVDNLIATARSNKVAVLLGMQDFSQVIRNYGKEVADVIINICGNIFSGQVVRETAKAIQDMFGKIRQKKESVSISKDGTSKTLDWQMDFVVPESKIANFSQGQFAVKVADNFDQQLETKISVAKIFIDPAKKLKDQVKELPIITEFPTDENGNSLKEEILNKNYLKIVNDIDYIISTELPFYTP